MVIAFGASLGSAIGTSPDNSWGITTTATVPSGGTIQVGIGWYNSDTTTVSVSGGGLTWTVQKKVTDGASRNTAIATAPAPAGLASGSTITVTVATGSFACGAAAKYVTSDTALVLDVAGAGSSGTTQAWSSSVTSATADTIITGFGWVDGLDTGSSTPATNYTEWADFVNGTDVNAFSGVYRIVSSTGTYTPGGTWNAGTNPWVAVAISMKESGGGGGGGPTPSEAISTHWKLRPPGRISPAGRFNATEFVTPIPTPPPVTVPDPPYFTEIGGSTPEFIVSSEDWALLCNGVINNGGDYEATYDDYFTTRAAQGYNAIEVTSFSVVSYEGGNDGPDYDDVYPFTGNSLDPLGTRNTAWWDRRDYFFSSAAAHGFRVFFNISSTYLGLGAFTASWSNAQWTAWGNHLATKYPASTHPHIFWIVGDDYFATVESGLDALYAALNSGGATQPKSIQWFQEATSRKSIYDGSTPGTTQWRVQAEYNWGYSYNPWYDVTEKMGVENSTLAPIPYVAADGFFLSTGPTGLTDEQLMRRMCWWAISSGAKGLNTGNNVVYPWPATAQGVVETNVFYTTVMGNIVDVVNSLQNWHLLLADMSNELVTSGRGTRITPIQSGDPQYLSDSDSFVTASWIQATSHRGELALIYMSHHSTITIDESKMAAGYTARWVDPYSGASTSTTTGSTYNSTPKGTNADGQNDWVLVLEKVTNVNGDATITGTGSLSAAGSVATTGGATITGTGALTATGQVAVTGGATLAGTGSMTATGAVATTAGATLAGTGSLTAAGAVATSAGASLSGTGSLSADGTVAVTGAVTISATGSLTADGTTETPAGVIITGTGSMTADGVVGVFGVATITGTGSVTATGVVAVTVGATISGTGSVTVAGIVELPGQGSALIAGTGSVSAAGQVDTTGAALITGIGAVMASGVTQVTGDVTIAATGSVVADGQASSPSGATIGLTGSMTASGVVAGGTGTVLGGTGTVTAVGTVDGQGSGVISGTGTLVVAGVLNYSTPVEIIGHKVGALVRVHTVTMATRSNQARRE